MSKCKRQHLGMGYNEEIEKYNFCEKCGGSGIYTYPSTSTWRGGIGGAAMTNDVCDKCWGSGKKDVIWPSHKKFEEMKKLLEKKNGN